MRNSWIIAGGLVLLLALGLAASRAVPLLLDWNRYRDAIATLASARLGREVRIAGPVSFTLTPEPVLTATDVSLADAGDGIAIHAAQLRLRVAPGALVAGRIDARELVLQGADMRLPWPFRPIQIAAGAPQWFATASVRLEDARLLVGGLAFTGIRATFSRDPWTGSFAAAGTLQLAARPWHFTARLTRPGRDGAAGLDAALDGRGPVQGVGATLSGQIHGDGGFGGRVSGHGPDLSQLLPAPPLPFSVAARVSLAGGLAAADELSGELGGASLRGVATLRSAPTPRLDLAMAIARLDLDAWLPAILRGGAAALPTGIDLIVDTAQLAGGTLRQLRGAFEFSGTGIAVRELHATLPGEASLRAGGQVQRGPLRFEGDVTLAAPALRGTLAWAAAAAGLPPAGLLQDAVLRSAELSARAVLQAGQLTLTGIDGRIDATRLTGSLGLRTGERPRLTASLQGDRLELDAWLPETWPSLAALPARLDRMDTELRLELRQAGLHGAVFGPVALEVATEAGQVKLRRLELAAGELHALAAGTLAAGGRVSEARLDIQAPSATALAEVAPGLPGWVRDMTRAWHGPATVSAQAAGPPEALALRLSAELGDLRLEAQPLIDLGGRRVAGVLTLRHPGAPRLAEAVGLRGVPGWLGEGSLGLVAQLAVQLPGERPGRVAAEQFDLSAGGLHAGGALVLESIGDAAAPPRLSGHIVADTLPLPLPAPRSPAPLPLGALLGWQAQVRLEAAEVLAGAAPVLQQAAAMLALADGRLRIDGLSARLAEGMLTGSASLAVPPPRSRHDAPVEAAEEAPALALDLQLAGAVLSEKLFDLPVDIAAGRLDATLSFTASGASPLALLSTLTGEARLVVSDGALAGVSLAEVAGGGAPAEGAAPAPPDAALPDAALSDAAVRAALAGGSTPFARLELVLRARRGLLQLTEGRMTGLAGVVRLGGSVDLAGATAELSLGLLPPVADPPEIGVVLAGRLDALRRVPDLAAVARWRAAHAGGR